MPQETWPGGWENGLQTQGAKAHCSITTLHCSRRHRKRKGLPMFFPGASYLESMTCDLEGTPWGRSADDGAGGSVGEWRWIHTCPHQLRALPWGPLPSLSRVCESPRFLGLHPCPLKHFHLHSPFALAPNLTFMGLLYNLNSRIFRKPRNYEEIHLNL